MAWKIGVLFLLSVLNLSSAFRFMGGESEGKTDYIGGEMGLLNAVPRMGKRMMGNPFDSRFRFRFNNWLSNSRLNGNAGFRFQGGNDGSGMNGYTVRKRAPTNIGGGVVSEPMVPVDAAAKVVDADLMSKDGLKPDPILGTTGSSMDDVNDKLEWYAVADEYWKEYLNDLARKAVIEKMAEMEMMPDPTTGAAPTPLAQYYARNPQVAQQHRQLAPQAKLAETEQKYPRLLPVMRSNF